MRREIITEKLERISKKIFQKYERTISSYIKKRHGVYALYDDKELYYVGRASDLEMRVKNHCKSESSSLWTHFSIYFTKKESYVKDIELIVISIAQPIGNKQRPKLKQQTKLKRLLKESIKMEHELELEEIGFSRKTGKCPKRKSKKIVISLKGYFQKRKMLKKTYKGKIYKAYLFPSGKIKYNKKFFSSPSAVATKIRKGQSTNGWKFWFIKDNNGNWIQLRQLR